MVVGQTRTHCRSAPAWTLLGAVLLLFAMSGAAHAEPKRVLLLHSFGRDFAPWNDYARVIREELVRQSRDPVDLYEASLETARFDNDEDGPFVDYLRALFAKRKLDLVVAIAAPAASFLQRHRDQLFPGTPMVITGLEQRRMALAPTTANDTVVASKLDFAASVAHLLRLLPQTTNIAMVAGNSPIERYWVEQIGNELQPFADRVTFTWLNELSFDEMLKRVAALPPRSAIFFALLSVDAAGVPHEQGKALTSLHAVANAPIFSNNDAYFGKGIVGGPLNSAEAFSRQAAGVAVRILGGEAPSSIKTPPIGTATTKYDWRELQRWNISEAGLPPGSEIHFRALTLWEQHRWPLVAILAALLLQGALIAGLLLERRRRHLAEMETRRRVLEVAHLNRTATAGVMSASIAHELNQPLGSILLNAATVDLLLRAETIDRKEIEDILGEIRRDDERAAQIIKGLSGFLKKKTDVEVQEVDLNDVVAEALHILKAEAGRKGVALNAIPAPAALPVRVDPVHLQQVILNLALNGMDAMQGGNGARGIALRTSRTDASEAMVAVSDNGPGIPADKLSKIFETFYTTKQQGSGLGLSIARTIVELYGGTIWAENRLDGGAVFVFTLPLAVRDAA